jgi:hypothetical protein
MSTPEEGHIEKQRAPVSRWRQRAGLVLLVALICGIVADAASLWLCGRYQGCYFDGRLTGLFLGAGLPAFAVAFLLWDRKRLVTWYGCYALSAIVQLAGGNLAVTLFMNGFQHAVLAAGNVNAWEGLPAQIPHADASPDPYIVTSRQDIPSSELPALAHCVYPRAEGLPWCYALTNRLQKSAPLNILLVWPSSIVSAGVLVSSPPGDDRVVRGTIVFEKALGEKVALVAFEEHR